MIIASLFFMQLVFQVRGFYQSCISFVRDLYLLSFGDFYSSNFPFYICKFYQ
uniref:Uncharacterized protein n=1 Tax=Ascaris lumbricoides TaxID=6252 RepID=A0A0M3IL02_ASCLU